MRNQFTLYARKVPSGKRVYYYYTYDKNGKLAGPWSTGQTMKTAAKNYCCKLIKEDKLLPGQKEIPTFAEFAVNFWDWEKCAYLKDRKKRRKLTQHYADKAQKVMNNTLIPYFGKMKLDKITGETIETWQDSMISAKKKNNTVNSYFSILMTMIRWAVKKRVIDRDPFLDVQKLIEDQKERKIITPEEFKTMFVNDWKKVWNSDLITCTANKLAALTGLRCCEVLGLKGEFVFDSYIYVCAQHDSKYGYRDTKTKRKDNLPLTKEVIADLQKLMELNGNGYVFSLDGGETPVSEKVMFTGFKKALANIGINEKQRKERGLDIHAWRHFCNTELLKGGLSIPQVQAVTRHKSNRMTERYAHIDPAQFSKVANVQDELLKPKTPKEETAKPVLKLVKPENQIKAS